MQKNVLLAIVLSIFMLFLLVSCDTSSEEEKITKLESEIEELNSEIDLYKDELSSAYSDLEEYSYYFAFAKDGEKVFHKYGCKHIEGFFVKTELPSLDDEIAELEVLVPDTIFNFSSKGYEPCEDCYTDDLRL